MADDQGLCLFIYISILIKLFLQGPVHAYVGMAGGRTAYLSELHTASQVMVVNVQGQSRTVVVGRVKIESRPLLLVEVELDKRRHSVLLQNAETVCLVAPGGGS
jgi:3-dehydroquinate synthase class II